MTSLCVGVPNGGTIKTQTVACLMRLIELGIPLYFSMPISGYSIYNRNKTVEKAKEIGASHIMFIDGDMLFTPSDVKTLLMHKKLIVGASYHMRDADGYTVQLLKNNSFVPFDGKFKGLFECGAVGTGFMLIDMHVFDKLHAPSFDTEFIGEDFCTEDVYFCKRAIMAGFKIWCDSSLTIGHLGSKIY
jgi:hypothetical protein